MKWAVCVLGLAAVAGPAAAQPSVGAQTINQTPQTLTGGLVRDGTPHVCVIEMRPTTRTVYTSVCKDYCRYDGSILGIIRRCCGTGGDCPCEMKTRTILIKKIVPGPDVPVCVAKEAGGGCAPCQTPAGAPLPGPGLLPGSSMPGSSMPGYVGLALPASR
ncbi:MAG: hypothetical protein JWO38_2101 [Gemmataceae bacterium]|nr:hypothetical protein [Gemmataceae bacterium]